MSSDLRRAALTAHVTFSVGTLGSVAVFLSLSIAGLAGKDKQLVGACYLAMEMIAWYVIVPLVLASLLTGIIQSLCTPWGLFRHYWVLAKLLLNVLVIVVLLLQLETISYLADMATEMNFSSDQIALRASPVIHAAGGLIALVVPVALSIYKPQGLTRYGWHRQYKKSPSPQQ